MKFCSKFFNVTKDFCNFPSKNVASNGHKLLQLKDLSINHIYQPKYGAWMIPNPDSLLQKSKEKTPWPRIQLIEMCRIESTSHQTFPESKFSTALHLTFPFPLPFQLFFLCFPCVIFSNLDPSALPTVYWSWSNGVCSGSTCRPAWGSPITS